jgi:hypothetical protein
MKLVITENQYKTILMEYYDSDKLYSKDFIVKKLKTGPKYMKKYINGLKDIPCQDSNGNVAICVKIPEVVYQFLFGNF